MTILNIDIEGLCLCHFNGDRMCAALLNSASEPALELPEHLPTLALPADAVDLDSSVGLDHFAVDLRGRIREDLVDKGYRGWDLTGVDMAIGSGQSAPARSKPGAKGRHPDPNSPDWSDMRWVIDVRRFAMASLLEPDVLEVGSQTRSIARFTDGSVEGAPPQRGNKLCDYVWEFSAQYQQAITDSLRYTITAAPASISLRKGATVSTIVLQSGKWQGHLINEATPADIEKEKLKPFASVISRHARSYYERFAYVSGAKMPPAPKRKERFRGAGKVDGVFCIVMTVGE